MTPSQLLSGLMPPPDTDGHFYGVTIGIVTNNQDPENLGRVKLRFPWLSDDHESHWARVLTLMAGPNRGVYFLPEVNDEVLVAFEHGQIEFPYVLGALWNGQDRPPESNADGQNNRRTITSRSGHTIVLDDTEGEEKIVICDKTGHNEIRIDSSDNRITVQTGGDLVIETTGSIGLNSTDGDLAIKCQNLSLQAQGNCEIKAGKNSKMEGGNSLTLNCRAGVKVNDGDLEIG